MSDQNGSFLISEGRLIFWGSNFSGTLGENGTSLEEVSPFEIKSFIGLNDGETINNTSLGSAHSILITSYNRVLTWGSNYNGQLGDGTIEDKIAHIDIWYEFILGEEETIVDVQTSNSNSAVLISFE